MASRKTKENDSIESDHSYFAKAKRDLVASGLDRNTAQVEAFSRAISRARASGAFVFVRMVVRGIVEENEIENSGPYYALATKATAAFLRGNRSEAARIISGSKLEMAQEIAEIFGF